MVIHDFPASAPVRSMGGDETRFGFATPAEAAAYLSLSKAMIHKLIGEGKVPASRYGRAVRIPWNWLKKQADPTSSTTEWQEKGTQR